MALSARTLSLPPPFAERDLNPPVVPGRDEELVVAPDGLPARVVKAHNAHKKHYIESYTGIVAKAMAGKWRYLAYIDTYAGPGICWVEDTGEFVIGSPLIALGTEPHYSHFAFIDNDSACVEALQARAAARGVEIAVRCADSNSPETIEWVRSVIPRQGTLALALLDPQKCNLELPTIEALTHDRRMDLMINLPTMGLYRSLAAGYFGPIEAVLGSDYPTCPLQEWRVAVVEHYKEKLAGFGYEYSSSKPVRAESTKTHIYDFVLASKHALGKKLFDGVTKDTAHGQITMF